MVDWKKDMKLSDLLARGKGDGADGEETKPFHQERAASPLEESSTDAEIEEDTDQDEETDTPFWKREISFGWRKAETEPDAEVDTFEEESEKRSLFTRSLSFGRAKDEAESETDFDSFADEPEVTTPFWKRELRFGRRNDDATTDVPVEQELELEEPALAADDFFEDRPEKTPFWKRRKHEAAPEVLEQGGSEPATEDVFDGHDVGRKPFWKRELSFGRRKDDEAPEDFEQPESAAASVFEGDDGEKTPFWKRDLSFGRRKDDATADDFEEPHEETHLDADVEKTPFWKRELSFGRRKDDEAPDDFEEPHEETHLDADVEKTPFWKRELSFGRRKDDESPEIETPVEREDFEHEALEPVAAAAAADSDQLDETTWTDEAAETPVETDMPADVEPEPVAPAVREPEPVDTTEDTTPEAPVDQEQPAPVEPEPIAPLGEGLEDTQDEAPFWKREIKFGRRRGDADLTPPVAVPLPPSDDAEMFAEAETEGTRFWKRELRFGRAKEEPFDEEFELPSDQEKKSFFKLSGRRAKDPDFDAPKPEKRPFYKRELSFRREKAGARAASAGRAARGSRTKHLVGLKVGASQIAAARIVNNGSPELIQLERQSIEQGIVVGGELRDPDALAEALREFFAKHKLPNKNVRLGIGNNRIGVRSFEISGVHDPKQLENAIRFRAQEALPIPLDEAVLDYQVIEETASPTGIRTYRVLLVVAYRELVDRYVAACRGAGLRLVGIDLEAFALLRALSPPPAEGLPEDTALVAVAIGHDRSTFAVSNGTVCEFTRVLDWGGSSLNTSISRALDITPSQAEPVKRTLSLSEGEEGAQTETNEHTIRAEEAVRLELQSFARELVSSLHFYQNQPGSLAIGSIALTGGTAHLPGLAAELQRLIGVKVRVGDPLRRVKTTKRVETPAQVGSMAVAIGLGIED
jgi:type IV pilus assembly protein PilM